MISQQGQRQSQDWDWISQCPHQGPLPFQEKLALEQKQSGTGVASNSYIYLLWVLHMLCGHWECGVLPTEPPARHSAATGRPCDSRLHSAGGAEGGAAPPHARGAGSPPGSLSAAPLLPRSRKARRVGVVSVSLSHARSAGLVSLFHLLSFSFPAWETSYFRSRAEETLAAPRSPRRRG